MQLANYDSSIGSGFLVCSQSKGERWTSREQWRSSRAVAGGSAPPPRVGCTRPARRSSSATSTRPRARRWRRSWATEPCSCGLTRLTRTASSGLLTRQRSSARFGSRWSPMAVVAGRDRRHGAARARRARRHHQHRLHRRLRRDDRPGRLRRGQGRHRLDDAPARPRPDPGRDPARHIAENVYLNGETIRLDGALRFTPKGAK